MTLVHGWVYSIARTVVDMLVLSLCRLQITSNDNEVHYQLQQLFENLKGDHKCVSTVKITKSLSIKNGEYNSSFPKFITETCWSQKYCICSDNCIWMLVFEQQDAVEWFEKILSVVSPDASQVLQQIFYIFT